MPAPISKLVQCLTEEADATTETLSAAIQLIAAFEGYSFHLNDAWAGLSRGPYAEDLMHQLWLIYEADKWPLDCVPPRGLQRLLHAQRPRSYWATEGGRLEFTGLVEEATPEKLTRALLIVVGQTVPRDANEQVSPQMSLETLESYLFHNHPAVSDAAAWAWALLARKWPDGVKPSPAILDRLLSLHWTKRDQWFVPAFALATGLIRLQRGNWNPSLASVDAAREALAEKRKSNEAQFIGNIYDQFIVLAVAFYSQKIIPDDEIVRQLSDLRARSFRILSDQ